VHTPPYRPEGRGKIERFFRSLREQFLASLDPKTLLTLERLNQRLWNERLWSWIDTFHRVDRLVRRDSTFLLRNRFFEAPAHLAGKHIEARFDPLDPAQLEIYCEGESQGVARLVDAVVNGRLPAQNRSTGK
jgi:putative transposase